MKVLQFIFFINIFSFVVGVDLFAYYHLAKCKLIECCSPFRNIDAFERNLTSKLHGQDIVIKTLIPTLKSHIGSYRKKALVISMHGWTGGGKTFTSQILIESLYGSSSSKFVHKFHGRLAFPLESKADEYKMYLQNFIKEKVSKCENSIFIFDEVDKIPQGVIDSIKPFMDYYTFIDDVDYTKAIYIFISNVGGGAITSKYLELSDANISRADMKYKDFLSVLKEALFTEEGGLKGSSVTEEHLVDLFLPYLPLEKVHLRKCAQDDVLRLGYNRGFYDDEVDLVLKELEYYKDRFSLSGCKGIHNAVVRTQIRDSSEL